MKGLILFAQARRRPPLMPSAVQGTSTYLDFTRKNLAPSRDFNNASWVKESCTVSATLLTATTTSGATPGLKTLQKLVEGTGAALSPALAVTYTSTNILNNGPFVVQVKARAAERSWLRIPVTLSDATVKSVWFDLTTGALGTVNSGVTAWIQNLGGGVYLCSASTSNSATGSGSVTGRFFSTTADGGSSYTGDGTSGLHLTEPVIRYGTVLTNEDAYTDPNPQIAFDVKPTNNIAEWSEDIALAWTAGGITSKNQAGTNARGWKRFKIIANNVTAAPNIARNLSSVKPNTVYWVSAVFQAVEYGHVRLGINTFSATNPLINIINLLTTPSVFNIANGATNGFITTLTSGEYLVGFQFNSLSGILGPSVIIAPVTSTGGAGTYVGDGVSGFHVSEAMISEIDPRTIAYSPGLNSGQLGSSTAADTSDPIWQYEGALFDGTDYIQLPGDAIQTFALAFYTPSAINAATVVTNALLRVNTGSVMLAFGASTAVLTNEIATIGVSTADDAGDNMRVGWCDAAASISIGSHLLMGSFYAGQWAMWLDGVLLPLTVAGTQRALPSATQGYRLGNSTSSLNGSRIHAYHQSSTGYSPTQIRQIAAYIKRDVRAMHAVVLP